MKRGFDWVFGIVSLLLGLALGCWVAFNLFVEMQPEAEGKSPLPALAIAALCLYVGVTRIRRAMRTEPSEPA